MSKYLVRQKTGKLENKVYELLRTVIDPELGVNVVDLGFVYRVTVTSNHANGRAGKQQATRIDIKMTLTTPGCMLGSWFVSEIREVVSRGLGIEGEDVMVEVVFDPPWTPELMSEEAKITLGWE